MLAEEYSQGSIFIIMMCYNLQVLTSSIIEIEDDNEQIRKC
jgi:hypothetical protein